MRTPCRPRPFVAAALAAGAGLALAPAAARGGVVIDTYNDLGSYVTVSLQARPGGDGVPYQGTSFTAGGRDAAGRFAADEARSFDLPGAQLYTSGRIVAGSAVRRDAGGQVTGFTASASATARAATSADPSGGHAALPAALRNDTAIAAAHFGTGQSLAFTVSGDDLYFYRFTSTLTSSGAGGSARVTARLGPTRDPMAWGGPPPADLERQQATSGGAVEHARTGVLLPGNYTASLEAEVNAVLSRGDDQPTARAAEYGGTLAVELNRIIGGPTVAPRVSGASYAGVSVAPAGGPTSAGLLGGTAGGGRSVLLAVVDRPADAAAAGVIGQAVELTGTAGDVTVLSVGYADSAAAGSDEQDLFLAWRDPVGNWVNAVTGNTGNTYAGGKFAGSYDDYLMGLGTAAPQLGAYGLDVEGNTVWAIINHNSLFGAGGGAVVAAVPEPLAALGGAGLVGLVAARRPRRGWRFAGSPSAAGETAAAAGETAAAAGNLRPVLKAPRPRPGRTIADPCAAPPAPVSTSTP